MDNGRGLPPPDLPLNDQRSLISVVTISINANYCSSFVHPPFLAYSHRNGIFIHGQTLEMRRSKRKGKLDLHRPRQRRLQGRMCSRRCGAADLNKYTILCPIGNLQN